MRHLICICLLLVVAGIQGRANSFTYTTIVVPGSPFTPAAAGINNSGEIVGYSGDSIFHGFLDNHGVFSSIDVAGSNGTQALGINNSGEIVGLSFTSMGGTNAFLDAHGTPTVLNLFGGAGAQANGINDSGEIVGYYNGAQFLTGFSYKNGTVTSIFVPNSTATEPLGINNSGQIVGYYLDSMGGTHSFLYSNGSFSPINVPGNPSGIATGINNEGEIVGYVGVGNFYEGFLDDNGSFSMFSVPGSAGTEAFGVNDLGDVVGMYFDANGGEHAFLATPTPEPASFLLIGMGGLALFFARILKKNA
jgi:probable HAF family extracellular repeat protein